MNETRQTSSITAALFALIAACLAYAALEHWSAPSLWYLPLARTWHFGAKPTVLTMSWYGRTLYMFVIALFAAAVGKALPWTSERFTRVSSLLAYSAVLLAVITCAAANIARATKPVPLPNGEPVTCVRGPE